MNGNILLVFVTRSRILLDYFLYLAPFSFFSFLDSFVHVAIFDHLPFLPLFFTFKVINEMGVSVLRMLCFLWATLFYLATKALILSQTAASGGVQKCIDR